jgi:uncharacterized protein (TIGR03437 family)
MLIRSRTAILVVACATAFGDTLVVPNNQTSTPGNMPVPLTGGGTGLRLQEIVGRGQFDAPIVITGFRLRSGVGTGAVTFNQPSVKLTLSTTQKFPNTSNGHELPSLIYASNVGPDAKTVYNAALSGSSPGCRGPAPCPFDLAVPFTAPFSYDPTKGNLLVDIVLSPASGTPTGSLDAVAFTDTTSSSVATVAGDATSAAGQLTLAGFVLGLDIAQGPTPTVTGILNGADYTTHICPGALVQIYGTNFGATASSVTFTVGGKQGFVANVVGGNTLVVQLPMDAPTGIATPLIVTVSGTASVPFNVTLDAYAPAIFSTDGSGTGPGRILTANNAKITTSSPAHAGDTVVVFAVGLGATNPAAPTGVATAANPTAATTTVTVGGAAATILFAGVTPGSAGLYQINMKLPTGVQGTVPVVLSIGGKSTTASITLDLFGITFLKNNASFGAPGTIAPGSIASVFANGLGITDQTTGYPSTTFQGVSVTFNGTPAPLFHMIGTAGQIDLLVPYELPTSGTVTVVVTTPSGPSLNYTLNMAATSPGIYFIPDPSTKTRFNVTAQFNNTAWLAMPASMTTALKLPACTPTTNAASLCGQPAAAGDFLVLYTTGLGKATPNGDPNGAQLKTGSAPPADGSVLYQTPVPAVVTVGGLPAKVVFSGIAPGFPGEYQVDFQVPSGITGDDVPVVVTIGGASDTRTLAIQPRAS